MGDEHQNPQVNGIDLPRLKRTVCIRFALMILFFGALFFLPAGTLRYRQAWIYMLLFFSAAAGVMCWPIKHDPELLARRMRVKEKEPTQRSIIALATIISIGSYLIPGFDRRFGWSSVPVAAELIAYIIIMLGYGLVVRVLLENRYASRIIEVVRGQKVITTGPYAVVRHPMYLMAAVMYFFSPLALGSYWGMIPGTLVLIPLIARILSEENVLLKGLEGYREYTLRTRYRLIPGIW